MSATFSQQQTKACWPWWLIMSIRYCFPTSCGSYRVWKKKLILFCIQTNFFGPLTHSHKQALKIRGRTILLHMLILGTVHMYNYLSNVCTPMHKNMIKLTLYLDTFLYFCLYAPPSQIWNTTCSQSVVFQLSFKLIHKIFTEKKK